MLCYIIGVSGLSTALCLNRVGYSHVHIYEKQSNSSTSQQSIISSGNNSTRSGIVIAANGVRILDRLGVGKQLYRSGHTISTVKQMKLTGALLSSYVPSSIVGERLTRSSESLTNVACWGHVLLSLL